MSPAQYRQQDFESLGAGRQSECSYSFRDLKTLLAGYLDLLYETGVSDGPQETKIPKLALHSL